METFQNLHINVIPEKKQEFFDELIKAIKDSKWKFRNDLIDNYKKNTFVKEKMILCAESESFKIDNKEIKGLLWMWDYSGYFEVFNIVPVLSNSLEYKEYNYILTQFKSNFIDSISSKYNAEVTLSKPEKIMKETIGEDAYSVLKSFSSGANKSTGNTHPLDFNRWCDFVFIIYRNKIELSVDELINWFVEDGWSDDMATKLGLEFEYSLDLLEKYEQD